jgi:signal transduction histidine kinase/PAS domain-containing protein
MVRILVSLARAEERELVRAWVPGPPAVELVWRDPRAADPDDAGWPPVDAAIVEASPDVATVLSRSRPVLQVVDSLEGAGGVAEPGPDRDLIRRPLDGAELRWRVGRLLDQARAAHSAEAEARLHARRFELLARATNDGIWDWDVSTNAAWGNEQMYTQYGYDRSVTPTYDAWTAKIHPDDKERVLGGFRLAVERRESSWQGEYRFLFPGGRTGVVFDRGFIAFNDAGQPMRMVGALMDITERRWAADSTALLADASAVLGSQLDYQRTLPEVARQVLPLLGDWCQIDLLDAGQGQGVVTVIPLATGCADERLEPLARAIAASEAGPLPASPPAWGGLHDGGHPLIASVGPDELPRLCLRPTTRPLMAQLGLRSAVAIALRLRGETLGWLRLGIIQPHHRHGHNELSVAADLAHRAALAIDTARSFWHAQGAIQVRDEFLSNAAHELRTPVSTLLGYGELLQETLPKGRSPLESRALDSIIRQCHRINHLVRRMLDLSRLQVGQFVLHPARHDLGSLLAQTVERLRVANPGRTLTLSCPGHATSHIDADRIEQVVTNLVDNAIKHSRDAEPIDIELTGQGDRAVVAIRDRGCGIPLERQGRLFERASQPAPGGPGQPGGLGIGLWICREIIRRHQGSLWFETEPGTGSTFYFDLPRAGGAS